MYIFPRLNIASIVAGLFRGYGLLVLLKWYRVINPESNPFAFM